MTKLCFHYGQRGFLVVMLEDYYYYCLLQRISVELFGDYMSMCLCVCICECLNIVILLLSYVTKATTASLAFGSLCLLFSFLFCFT